MIAKIITGMNFLNGCKLPSAWGFWFAVYSVIQDYNPRYSV